MFSNIQARLLLRGRVKRARPGMTTLHAQCIEPQCITVIYTRVPMCEYSLGLPAFVIKGCLQIAKEGS